MKQNVQVQCSWLGDRQHSIEEPWGNQGEEEAGDKEKQLGVWGSDEGAEGEDRNWVEKG